MFKRTGFKLVEFEYKEIYQDSLRASRTFAHTTPQLQHHLKTTKSSLCLLKICHEYETNALPIIQNSPSSLSVCILIHNYISIDFATQIKCTTNELK